MCSCSSLCMHVILQQTQRFWLHFTQFPSLPHPHYQKPFAGEALWDWWLFWLDLLSLNLFLVLSHVTLMCDYLIEMMITLIRGNSLWHWVKSMLKWLSIHWFCQVSYNLLTVNITILPESLYFSIMAVYTIYYTHINVHH